MKIDGSSQAINSFISSSYAKKTAQAVGETVSAGSGAAGQKGSVTNATFDEFQKIAREMYDSGEISLGQMAIMIFDPSQSFPGIKWNLTAADQYGRRNWITEFQARAARNDQLGNALGATRDREVVEALKRQVS